MKKHFIIVAGINGAGKSTLYNSNAKLFLETSRVNADEILKSFNGDWRNQSDNYKAMRQEVKLIHHYLGTGVSFHVETTLSGKGTSILNLIEIAHNNGYEVTLLYVGLESSELAIKRISDRVKKGGHGVPDDLVRKRYVQSKQNLPKVAQVCDNVIVFDNSDVFNNVFIRKGNVILKNSLKMYPWIEL